jgi:hypothetical protein
MECGRQDARSGFITTPGCGAGIEDVLDCVSAAIGKRR